MIKSEYSIFNLLKILLSRVQVHLQLVSRWPPPFMLTHHTQCSQAFSKCLSISSCAFHFCWTYDPKILSWRGNCCLAHCSPQEPQFQTFSVHYKTECWEDWRCHYLVLVIPTPGSQKTCELKLSSSALNQYVYFTRLCRQENKEKEGVIKTSTTSKINRKWIIRNTVCL